MIVSPNSEKILSATQEKITGPGNLYWICISVSIILYAYLLYAGGVDHSIYASLLVATFLPTPVFLGHIEQLNSILNLTGGLPLYDGLPLYELAFKQVVSQRGYGYIGFVPLVGVVHCFFAYKRLKELNLNKYLFLVVLVPLLGQIFLVMLGTVKTRPDLSRLKKLRGLNLLKVFIEKRTVGQQNFTAGYTPQDGFIRTLMHLFSFVRKCSLLEVWVVLIATASFVYLYFYFSKPNTDFPVLFQTPISDLLVKGGILLLLVSLLVRRLRALNWSLWLILFVNLAGFLSMAIPSLFLVLLLFVPSNVDLKQLRLLNFPSNPNPTDNEDTQIMKPATEGQTAEKTKNTNAAQAIVSEENAKGTQTKKEPPITKRQDEKQLAISDINEEVQEAPWQYPVTVMDIESDKSGSNMKQFLEANSPILKAKRLAARPLHDGHKWVVLITSPSGQETFNLNQVVELTQWVNKCR